MKDIPNRFRDMPLAVIGMACRLPGADNLDEYWRLLCRSETAITELPPERLDQDLYYHPERGIVGKTYSKLGGVVADRPFDRESCPISEELIAASDSVPLAMLEVAAAACRHAGLDPFALPLKNAGVFVGHARGGALAGDLAYGSHIEETAEPLSRVEPFARLAPELRAKIVGGVTQAVRRDKPRRSRARNPDIAPNAVAGLISDAFALTGPYMAVDAACASSLYAVLLAAQSLHRGAIDMAIVGGASYSNWYSLVLFSQAQALSAAGSFPFDARADGFISSDGYGAILIKTLDKALADGDRVYGVIRGIGVSCDGRGRSLWAPRKEGQIEAIRRAYFSGLDPSGVQYIEAHGTSTRLGDATELAALAAVFAGHLPAGTKVPICSVKANIGHTRETAGIAGMIKTLLCMHHGMIPAAANFAVPNPEVPWEQVPFYVPTGEVAWPRVDGRPRRAGIDSFGIGGLNLHLVLDDRPPEPASVVQVSMSGNRASPHGIIDEEEDAVAIIGLGAIMPGARTAAAYWDLLAAGRDPKREIPRERWNADLLLANDAPLGPLITTRLGGFITDFAYDWQKHKIPPRQLETADPLQFMLLDAADQALRDAGHESKPFDGRRAAVVVGTIFGGDFARGLNTALRLPEFQATLAEVMRDLGLPQSSIDQVGAGFAEVFMRGHPLIYDETGSYTSSTLASRIAKTYDLTGGAFAVDAGEASSLAALGAAAGLISSGACDWVLCAGGQRSMDLSVYEWYALKGVLSAGRPRPAFDAAADGFVPAEGVGMLVLKRLSAALRDGDPIRAIVRSVGAGTNPGSAREALRLGMARALGSSGLEAEAVKIVETAGTGAPALDSGEAEALAEVYGAASRKEPLLLGSVADQIGHTQGAAGMASLIKLTLAFQHGKLPAAFTLDAAERSTIALPEENKLYAAASAFALRGSGYHVVLERPGDRRAAGTLETKDWRIVRIGAENAAGVLARLEAARKNLDAVFGAAPASAFATADRVRLAVVVDDCESLSQKLALAQKQILNRAARGFLDEQGIYYREAGSWPPRLAFVFPGQGSQYCGMLRELVAALPAAAAAMKDIDETMRGLGLPSFEEIAWNPAADLAGDVWLAQISVLLADLIVYAAVTAAGVKPDIITAHSYGEYAALVAAGSWTLEQAIRVTRARCRAVEASPAANGAMLSTTAPADAVERLIASGDAYIANYNAPDQTVIGGDKETISRLSERLGADGFEARLLPVPRPFHTPLMAEVKEPMRRALEEEKLFPPRVPLLSSVTNRYVAEPADIRANLVEQLTQPVRYMDLVGRLVDEGVTLFVEVGPRQILTGLHRRLIGGRAGAAGCDHPKRAALDQLCRARALLECAGAPASGVEARPESAARSEKAPIKHPIVHFDATSKRRERLRHFSERKPEPAPAAAQKNNNGSDDLESFIVGFVCEQTGYPPEIVDLDADLEADLGIDSIKKARLLGELRERFDISVQPTAPLSLDDFPTLRHILDFIRKFSPGEAPPAAAAPVRQSQVAVEAASPLDSKPIDQTESPLVLVKLSGTPYEMGVQHARSQGDRIKNILQRYSELLPIKLDDVPELREALGHGDLFFTPAGLEELQGLADELGKPVEHLMAYNLGLYPQQLGGCAQFAIKARANGVSGLIHGANEDSPLSLSLTGCLTRIVQWRRQDGAIPHVLFSVSGQLGGLNGLNARGVAVTSTMLLDRDAGAPTTPARTHPVLVKTILERAEDVDQAIEIVRGAPTAGAWSLCLSHHPADRLCYVEYDGDSLQVQEVSEAIETTNHCFAHPALQQVPEHSLHRLDRLRSLLTTEGTKRYGVEQARAALRDRYDLGRKRATLHPTMNTLKRLDNQISLVMEPAAGKIWATPGPLANGDADHYYPLDVSELFVPNENGGAAETSQNGSAKAEEIPAENDGRIMSRFVLRMAEAPPARSGPEIPKLHGPALILGDNPSAHALKALLENNGEAAQLLPVGGDSDETLSALEGFWREKPAPHLFLMTARDADAAPGDDEQAWNRRRGRGVMLPYLVCRRWLQLVFESRLTAQATLAAATALGGDFGFSGGAGAVEGGGLAGLLKAIRREFGELRVKVVDLPPEEPPKDVAACLCRELACGGTEIEVGYVRGRRRVVRAVPRPATPLESVKITRGGSCVVTGGARGITAVAARALGEKFGLKLHLIGKTPLAGPNGDQGDRDGGKTIEIEKTLVELSAGGISAAYHACDVGDREALARLLDEIRRRDGAIRGVIHGAGVEEAARFDRKQPDKVSATIAAKVDGAGALMALTREDPLEFFVAFGSVSGRFGGHGQTDYSLASDMLCKLVSRFRAERPECASVAVHWPAWDEVGMALRPETKVVLQFSRQTFMPPAEGVRHLLDELAAGSPEAEVLLIDRPGLLDVDKTLPEPSRWQAYRRLEEPIRNAPLIEGVCELGENSLVAEARLNPGVDPFLRDHRFKNRPLLPSVITLELFAEAASLLLDGGAVAFRRLEFLNGLRFHSSRPVAARVGVVVNGSTAECALRADFYNAQGRLIDPDRLYATGCIGRAEASPHVAAPDEAAPSSWHPMEYLEGAAGRSFVFYGPSLRCLKEIVLQADGGWGRIVAPSVNEAGGGRTGTWRIPAAVLDACLLACGAFGRRVLQLYQLPEGIESLRVRRLPDAGEILTARVHFRSRRENHTFFDFTLFGADGTAIVCADGVRFVGVSAKAKSDD